MRSFPLLLVLLVSTVLAQKDRFPVSFFKLLIAPGEIDYSNFQWKVSKSNESIGWPYPNEFMRPFTSFPSHVIPDKCNWYSERDKSSKDGCRAVNCPEGQTELFRGITAQKTHHPHQGVKWHSTCPREYGVKVPATFCCEPDVFTQNFTVGIFSTNGKDFKSDCQWIGARTFCNGPHTTCPARKWRNEVARASLAWKVDPDADQSDEAQQYRHFGGECQGTGDRILCCQDEAFEYQRIINLFITTELNYIFPALQRKRTMSKYAGQMVKLIFAPGATKPPPTTPTTPTTPHTTTSSEVLAERREDEDEENEEKKEENAEEETKQAGDSTEQEDLESGDAGGDETTIPENGETPSDGAGAGGSPDEEPAPGDSGTADNNNGDAEESVEDTQEDEEQDNSGDITGTITEAVKS